MADRQRGRQQSARRRSSNPSGRYTAPAQARIRRRPGWHRWSGWLLVLVGLVLAALNGLMYMADDLTLLPGGFSLLYVPFGLPLAAGGAWLLGLFDDGQTIFG